MDGYKNSLCNLKTLTAQTAIDSATLSLEVRINNHYSGEWELIDKALEDCKHDLTLLRNLGAT